jgi:hypothetical protein
MSVDINLLPQRKIGYFSPERILLFSRSAAVASIILVVSLSILFFILSKDPTVTNQKVDEQRTLAQLNLLQSKTAKYLIIIDRVNKIKIIENQRSNFDQTMSILTDQIPSGITVAGFTMDKKTFSISLAGSDLSLIGIAVDDFTKLITQKKIIKSLTIQGLVTDEKNGTYVLSLSGGLL